MLTASPQDNASFKPHDRVVIGGRTMLRPGYSLTGMSGTVFAVGGFCPPGQVQVIVDDETVDEADGSRALVVNVPTLHLTHLSPQLITVEQTTDSELSSESASPEAPSGNTDPEDDDTPPPMGLRLV
jgi:hypothetical protein